MDDGFPLFSLPKELLLLILSFACSQQRVRDALSIRVCCKRLYCLASELPLHFSYQGSRFRSFQNEHLRYLIRAFPRLESLAFASPGLSQASLELLRNFTHLRKLRLPFSMDAVRLKPRHFATLKRLRSLTIFPNPSIDVVALCDWLTGLRSLHLTFLSADVPSLDSISSLISLEKLEFASICSTCTMSDGLLKMKRLRKLHLSAVELSIKAERGLPLLQLQEFSCIGCSLVQFPSLAALPLRVLLFDNTKIMFPVERLQITQLTRLEALVLRGCALTDEMIPEVLTHKFTRLRRLSLSENYVSCRGLEAALHPVYALPALEHLTLSQSPAMSDDCMRILLRSSRLQSVSLESTAIAPASLSKLARLQQLQDVCVSGADEEIFRSLLSLPKLTRLCVLDSPPQLTADLLLPLIQTCPQLLQLDVESVKPACEDRIEELLRKRRPIWRSQSAESMLLPEQSQAMLSENVYKKTK